MEATEMVKDEELSSFLQSTKEEDALKKKITHFSKIEQFHARKALDARKRMTEIMNEIKKIRNGKNDKKDTKEAKNAQNAES